MLEVANILTWKQANETPASWRGQYEDLLEARIQTVAAATDEGLCILEALAMLPRDRQRVFLRAPQIASRVLMPQQPGEFDSGPVAKGLLAELAVAGVVLKLSDPIWTVLGNRCLDPANPAAWCEAGSCIPGTHIVVDGAGPTDFSTAATGPLVLPVESERTAVQHQLTMAARAIASASASSFAFWVDCVDVIAIRTAVEPATRFSSNSFLRNARLMLILNGHLAGNHSAPMAEAMIHEAIHSLLFMYEAVHAPIVPAYAEVEFPQIRSPWSGKDLFLSAYVHACVVWYGLYWFWTAAAETSAWSAPCCSYFRDRARAGFAHHPFANLPSGSRRLLSAESVELLADLENRMLSV